jgi:SAM-dependent methyltransferase
MRALAERVGPAGRVLGIDRDASLGVLAVETLHGDGHRQCSFREHDLSQAAAVPGGPFDLVYARLLLFHLPQRVEALARLWAAVAPGGHLVVQDYDFRSIGVLPDLASIGELTRVFTAAFLAVGADVHVGSRLPELFRAAGVGAPDGTDVAGYLDPLPAGSAMLAQVFRSVLPVALAHGITTEENAAATLAAAEQDAARYPDGQLMWPLLVGAWKCKEPA